MKNQPDSSGKKNIAILGSTGSIGTQALDILEKTDERFSVYGLTAHTNWQQLARQVNKFTPARVVLVDETNRKEFEAALTHQPEEICYGAEALHELASDTNVDLVLNSLVGFAGFMSTYEALKKGNRVALANKESLVAGGEILSKLPGFKDLLIPVDSEHSAMFQCMIGEPADSIEKIIITASGGPFRNHTPDQMKSITVEDALKHPNWEMGNKITIDSSTMMNKGLEIIEAHWLFSLDVEKIEPVIHPQSIIHSIVQFKDGSSKAQLGLPDMKVPIIYALGYPDRIPSDNLRLDYTNALSLTFEPVDENQFPCIRIAIDAIKEGGILPAIMNAANEVAVKRFMNREIRYIQIPELIERSLEKFHQKEIVTPQTLFDVDKETRKFANTLL